GVSPLGYLIKRIGAGAQVSASTPEEIAAIQAQELLNFARGCPHAGVTEVSLPIIAGGSEHLVFLDENSAKVIKITRVGIYGDWYYLKDDVVNQEKCSPVEYLLRL